jgi:hypothetical protein
MIIEHRGIANGGSAELERIHLKALGSTDLRLYVLFLTSQTGTSVARTPRHVFWFYSHQVASNDDIIIYTRAGTDSVTNRDDGGKNHFFFWGLREPQFNTPSDCVVLLELGAWSTFPPSGPEPLNAPPPVANPFLPFRQ